jgi:hypothetical protein
MSLSPSRKEHYNLDNSLANHTGLAVKRVLCFLLFNTGFTLHVCTCFFRVCVCVLSTLSGWEPWLKKGVSPVKVCQQIVTDVSEKRSASICRVIKTKISLWSCKMLLTNWHGITHMYSTLRTIRHKYCNGWGRHMDIGVKKRRDIKYQYKINFGIQSTVHRDIFL